MLSLLKEPSLAGVPSGTQRFFTIQKNLILNRPLLKRSYDDWYRRLLSDAASAPPGGVLLELGSGGSYLKDLEPSLVTSDVVADVADKVIDARHMPFADASVRALFLTHVFHHIPDVDAFFKEAERVLKPGGVISMIEIAHTPFARFFFRNFHHEPYDDSQRTWPFAQNDSMMDSNQALSWIVFVRDRAEFERKYPGLTLELVELMPWFTYFVSGGVTMRYLIPRCLNPLLVAIEYLLSPLAPLFSLYWQIRIRKKTQSAA
ncbi:MAG TPA: class I SAM-dependent methyltransferase [Candidatus Dormibacteraeota bacterium]|nr:class I SAM-dependent methyltransferase [Candidatus Dormibacteraeota bacterium]